MQRMAPAQGQGAVQRESCPKAAEKSSHTRWRAGGAPESCEETSSLAQEEHLSHVRRVSMEERSQVKKLGSSSHQTRPAVECGSSKRVAIGVYVGEQDPVNTVRSQCGPKDAQAHVERQSPRRLRTYSCHEEY